ncbi:MAG: 4'-phosphopantetheinyl transferase superfamily protein [Proteobacteria bacterium]|nr:4'-phosphopantetheinyl transferase superfamily protein [Pseudomonadota bacterium]
MIFDILPPPLTALCNTLFPGSFPTVAILPLPDLEQDEAILRSWLHTKEMVQLAGYVYPKRRKEWLSGRICAKQALRAFLRHAPKTPLIPEHNQCRVASEESGQPYFDQLPGIAFPFPQLSITHSKSFAAALVSTTRCGIDIQFPSEGLQRVKEKFCTEEELQQIQEALPHLSQLSGLALLWTGKEAIKKMLSAEGIPGFQEIQLCKISDTANRAALFHFSTATVQETSLPVITGLLNNGYGMALCCLNDQYTGNSNPPRPHARTA